MTQRRRAPRRRKKIRRRVFLAGLGGAALAAGAYIVHHSIQNGNQSKSPTAPEAAPEPNPALPSGEWRAVWVSYLEWARMDFSSEEAFRAAAAELLDNSAALGLNTVIAQVRPFGDALYESSLFPWSHLCTGTQGQGPGFDPLDVLVTEAHGRGLSLEAWVNPYRLKSSAAMPPTIQFVLEPDSLRERVRVRFLFIGNSAEGLHRALNEQRQGITMTVVSCLLL